MLSPMYRVNGAMYGIIDQPKMNVCYFGGFILKIKVPPIYLMTPKLLFWARNWGQKFLLRQHLAQIKTKAMTKKRAGTTSCTCPLDLVQCPDLDYESLLRLLVKKPKPKRPKPSKMTVPGSGKRVVELISCNMSEILTPTYTF